MSLFKARNWWNTNVSNDENESFDKNSLLIARLSEGENDNLIVGSHAGYLRIYKVTTERLDDGTLTKYKPTDLILEKLLPYPILGLGLGKLVSGSQKWYICVLQPLRVTIYSLKSLEGITDHGDQNLLNICYEHILSHSSYSMVIGPFGGAQGRDFICVQSLNGNLNIFEQESIGFKCILPNFLLPSPLCYVMRTDSFVTVTSNWFVESYRYQNMSQSESSGKLTPTWYYNLGEGILNIMSLPLTSTETVIVILGEKNLYCLTDIGKLKFMKKLDFVPICFYPYVIGWYWEPDARLMVGVASNSGTFLLYEGTTLKWSAQLPCVPVAMSKATVPELPSSLVTLSEDGQLQCSYLGTEPELFSAPPMSLKPIDYEEAKLELENLHAIIKSNTDSADMVLINSTAEKELQFSINIDTTLKPLPHIEQETFKNDKKSQDGKCIRILVKIKSGSNTFEQIQVSVTVIAPLVLTQDSLLFRNVTEEKMFETFCYLDENKYRNFSLHSVELKVVISYVNVQGLPRILQKTKSIPMHLVYNLVEPLKDAKFKVTINISHPATPLSQLFPEFSSIAIPTAIGLSLIHKPNHVVSIIIGKNSQRYRLQSDFVEDLAVPCKVLCERLKAHFDSEQDFRIICTSALPIQELLITIDKHFESKIMMFEQKDKLARLASQYRLIQRRLLAKLKDKIPTPMSGLESLLKESLLQIKNGVEDFNKKKYSLFLYQADLNAILELTTTILKHMNLQKNILNNVCALLATPVQDLEDQAINGNQQLLKKEHKEPLVKISNADLPELRDLLKSENYPETIFIHYFVDNYLNWLKKQPSTCVDFYSVDGKWRDGTFLGYLTDQNYVVIYSRNPDVEDWEKLANSKILKWKDGLMIGCLHSKFQKPVLDALKININLVPLKVIPCYYHWLSKENALEFNTSCPNGLYFGDLRSDQSSYINSFWPHAFPDSVKFVRDQIVLNGGLGLYEKSSNNLVCWILLNNYGGIGMLHTLEQFRRKGFGELITKEFCKKLASVGRDIFAATVDGNISANMFKKLGFTTLGLVTWYQF